MNIRPMKTNVIVAEIKRKETSDGGIIIAGAASANDTQLAKVTAVGPDVTEVAIGDSVLVTWNKAKIVYVDGDQRVMLKEEDIIAVIE